MNFEGTLVTAVPLPKEILEAKSNYEKVNLLYSIADSDDFPEDLRRACLKFAAFLAKPSGVRMIFVKV